MKTTLAIALFVVAASAAADTGPNTRREASEQWRQAGLQRLDMRGMDLAYARAGTDVSAYRRVLLGPVQIQFQRNWARSAERSTGSRVPARDFEQVEQDLSAAVRAGVAREFESAGYTLVAAPGPGVLQVDVRVTELFLNAPDLPGAAQTRSFTQRFGEMNLVADLRDSSSGEVLLSVLDRSQGRDFDTFRLTTRADNAHEVGWAAQAWARVLLRQLELARIAGGGSNDRP